MPNEPGFFDSPGERARRERFSRQREEVVDFLGPFVADGLRSATESADESLTQLAAGGLFNLQAPTVEPRLRPTPPATLAPPTMTPEPDDRAIFGLEPPTIAPTLAPQEPTLDERLRGSLVRAEEEREAARLAPPSPFEGGGGLRAQVRQITSDLAGVPAVAAGALERFREIEEPGAAFVGKSVLEGFGVPGTDLNLTRIPGAETVATELARPTNLVPIPILDPLIARGIGLAVKAGVRVTPQVLRTALAKAATRLAEATLGREERVALEQFRRQGEENLQRLVAERPLGGAAGEVADAVPAAPVEPPGPPAQSATGGELPGRGNAGAKAALALKEETLLRPGRVTQLPGIKQVTSGLNPSVTIDREVLVSYNARQAVTASLETEFAALRRPTVQRLQAAWDAQPPRYTGPEANAMKNTIKDWADNPDFYTAVSPELRAAAQAYDAVSDQILARTRGEFNVDINAFAPSKPGAFYLPTVQARETLDDALLKVSQGYTSSGVPVSSARAKARVYEGAYQRSVKNPGFQAETDLAELTGLHDRALATMGGNETFRLGAGGRSKFDVMQELHPELASRMVFLRQRLTNLRGQAGRLNEKTRGAIDEFLANPDGSLGDLADALDVTVKGRRKDVPVSPAKIRGVGEEIERLRRQTTVRRGQLKGADIKAVNAEIKSVRQDIRKLRPAWESANLEPFVLNRSTFRYHEAEQSAAVDKILLTKLPMGEGLLQAIDEVRLFAFAADVSPLTIQGLLGILSDPITGARSLPAVARTLFSPEELVRVAGREPEVVARFTQATGRPFGQLGSEFVQRARGIERIPGGRQLNDSLMSALEMLRFNQWKTDTAVLQKLNPGMSQAVADAEAANALSKIVPALNPAERGASVLQARLERTPVISTSFIGGPATVIKDAASGMAKLTASRSLSPGARWQGLSGREQLAILHLSSIAGTIATAAISSHILSGFSPEEAVKATLDPNSPRFLAIALGPERRIPIGGPLRSAVKAFVPQKVGEVKGVPVYVPFTGVPQWLKNKGTPGLKAPFDLARNADYFGGKIATGSFPESMLRSLWFGVNSVLPLAIQEPSEAIRRGEIEPTDVGGIAERAGSQLAGVDLRETSPFETARRLWAERHPGQEWNRQIAAQDPVIAPFLKPSAEREERDRLVAERAGQRGLDVFAEGVRENKPKAAENFISEYFKLATWRSGLNAVQFKGFDFPEPGTAAEEAIDDVFNIDRADFILDDGEFDSAGRWAEQDERLDNADRLNPGFRDAFENALILPPELQDVERRAKDAMRLRDDLEDIGEFENLAREDRQKVRRLQRQVEDARDADFRAFTGDEELQEKSAYIEAVGESEDFGQVIIDWALALNTASGREANYNPAYIDFIRENRAELELFYSDLFTRRVVRDLR